MLKALDAHDKYLQIGFVPLSDMMEVMDKYTAENFEPEPGMPVETLAPDLSWKLGLVTTVHSCVHNKVNHATRQGSTTDMRSIVKRSQSEG